MTIPLQKNEYEDAEYDTYKIKIEPSTAYILGAYKRDCGIPGWRTLDYLLDHNLHKLETNEKRDWMDKLWWTIGDDYQLEKQIKSMVPTIEFPIQGKQKSTTLKIKVGHFNRINELKAISYIYSEMSIAKKLALITCIHDDFTLPLDTFSVTTMLKRINGQYVNKLFEPTRTKYNELPAEARRFFYNSSNAVIYQYGTQYGTAKLPIEKKEIVNTFIIETLDQILERQTKHLLVEEAGEMDMLVKNMKNALDSYALSRYYKKHESQKLIVDKKINEALNYLESMKEKMKEYYEDDDTGGSE